MIKKLNFFFYCFYWIIQLEASKMSAPLYTGDYYQHQPSHNPEYTTYQSVYSPIPQQARTVVYHIYHPSEIQNDDCGISFLIFEIFFFYFKFFENQDFFLVLYFLV